MSLKNIMPDNEPIKMQEGTTLPFARQQGATSPRAGGLLDRQGRILLPDDTGPTIGLPGQQPIDDLNRFQPVGDPIPFDPEKERLKKELEKAQQVQTNIDPNVPMGTAFNQDHFDAGIAKTNLSPAEIANLSPAMRESIQLYGDPENVGGPEFVDKVLGTVTKGISKAVPGIGFISKAAQVATNMQEGKPIFIKPETQAFPAKLTRTAIGTADPLKTKTTDPFASSRALYRSPGATAPAVTSATVGAALFGDDPTYAGGAKEGRDGLYAAGGSGSFTSFSHFKAGISQKDETNIITSGNFSNVDEGRNFINNAIQSGFTENEIETLAKNPTVTTNISMSQAPAPDVDPGKSIICTQMYKTTGQTDWDKAMKLWYVYQVKYLTPFHQDGYHYLFSPFVKGMKKSRILTAIGAYFAKHRTNQIKHELYKKAPFDIVGKLTNIFLHPTVYLVGRLKNLMENK